MDWTSRERGRSLAPMQTRRSTLLGLSSVLTLPVLAAAGRDARKPNIIVVLADDLGYGDLGSYGSNLIRTPNIDRMAREGVRMTDFYASANICTPSRAGLLTGRYPIRTGLAHQVIQASDTYGLPESEVTLAEALKPHYTSALIGKWHLGHVAPFWPPTRQGFDLFFGLPYSHDMKPLALYDAEPGVELTQEDVVFDRLTQRFFDRGIKFIEDNRDKPFFLMLALTAPHVPLDPHPDHIGRSPAAAYGDIVEEVDAQIGRLRGVLRQLSLDRDTIVMITSDNGPWFEGSAGDLRDRKGGAGFDGGYRVPFIAWGPGRVPRNRTPRQIAMNTDIFPTVLSMAGMTPPQDVTIDGADLAPVWARSSNAGHEELVLFDNERVAGIRTDRWKFVARSYYRTYDIPLARLGADLLFDMRADPAENYNLESRYPDVVADLRARFERARALFEPMAVRQGPERFPGLPPDTPSPAPATAQSHQH
jgi:arylsulfatase A